MLYLKPVACRTVVCLVCLSLHLTLLAAPTTREELLAEGTRLGLLGDYAAAYQVADELRRLDPNGTTGLAFNLNTLLTQLSWDESATEYDEPLRTTAENILSVCEARLQAADDAMAHYHCGLANFSLAFLNALRGHQYRAGVNGTRAIRHFESALALQPDMIEPRLQLGMAYFYADNLPPYIKLFSRLLWFIPSGHSEKSLPYVRSVMESDSYLRDVARFVYSDLASEGDAAERAEARMLLEELVQRYPQNPRLQLALVTLLVQQRAFEAAIDAVNEAVMTQQFSADDRMMLQLWQVRALLGAGEQARAIQVVDNMPTVSPAFPNWARAWLLLTEAQLFDLKQERDEAVARYQEALNMKLVSEAVVQTAKRGLREPFSLP
ncbi:MAG: tetratricopeptide repeat protein [Pseudomonadota bacterium]